MKRRNNMIKEQANKKNLKRMKKRGNKLNFLLDAQIDEEHKEACAKR